MSQIQRTKIPTLFTNSGLQRLTPSELVSRRGADLDTVQGILEYGLRKVTGSEKVWLFTSSRTDVRVHAVESTAHFDLDKEKYFGNLHYCPESICQELNRFLELNECDIRVNRIVEVQDDFNCRRAVCRTYQFRLGVLNNVPPHVIPKPLNIPAQSIFDLNRIELTQPPFDFSRIQEACKLFVGTWDFSSFMKSSPQVVEQADKIKTIRKFSIAQEKIPEKDLDSYCESLLSPPYDIYTFTIEGSGFLRRQVRRMVGALVSVGKGIISAKDILWMLQNPSEQNWSSKIHSVGPNGLALKRIEYGGRINILRGYLS